MQLSLYINEWFIFAIFEQNEQNGPILKNVFQHSTVHNQLFEPDWSDFLSLCFVCYFLN